MTFEIKRPRIMICEDETLIALHLAALIESAGCEAVGPFRSIRESRSALRKEEIDAAILDIELSDGASTPVAAALQAAGAPFVVLSGLRTASPPPEFAGVEWLSKPVDEARLRAFCAAAHARFNNAHHAPKAPDGEPSLHPML